MPDVIVMLPVSLPSNPDDAEETSTIPLPRVLPIPLIREIPPPVFELLLPPEISIEPPEAEGCWALPAKTAMSPATKSPDTSPLATRMSV